MRVPFAFLAAVPALMLAAAPALAQAGEGEGEGEGAAGEGEGAAGEGEGEGGVGEGEGEGVACATSCTTVGGTAAVQYCDEAGGPPTAVLLCVTGEGEGEGAGEGEGEGAGEGEGEGGDRVLGTNGCAVVSPAWGADCVLAAGTACDPGYAFGQSRCDPRASLHCVDGTCQAAAAPDPEVQQPTPGTRTTPAVASSNPLSCLGCGSSTPTSSALMFGALVSLRAFARRVRRARE